MVPGPAGVLWSVSHGKSNHDVEEELTQRSSLFPSEEDADLGNTTTREKSETQLNRNKTREHHDASSPQAWSTMQQSLGIVTPYLPSHTQGDVKRRYELLRSHLPVEEYCFLYEILRGDHDVKMKNLEHNLCVWVHSIDETNIHHGVWTVELRDETGANIRAWIEPKFVQAELQKAQSDDDQSHGVVRAGVVWMLSNISMIVFKSNDDNLDPSYNDYHNSVRSNSASSSVSSITRLLVVSENNIKEVWTPEQHVARTQPSEEDDSPEAQRKYLDWMEKRKALTDTSSSENHQIGHDDDVDNDDAEEEDKPEEEDYEFDHDDQNLNAVENDLCRPSRCNVQTFNSPNQNCKINITRNNQSVRDTDSRCIPESMEDIKMLQQESSIYNSKENVDKEKELRRKMTLISKDDATAADQTVNRKRKKDSTSSNTNISEQSLLDCTVVKETREEEVKSIGPIRKDDNSVRFADSFWNTPDAWILRMLDIDEKREGKRIFSWDVSTHNSENRQKVLKGADITVSYEDGNRLGTIETRGEENDDNVLMMNYNLGESGSCGKLFEQSNWAAFDVSLFSDNDD